MSKTIQIPASQAAREFGRLRRLVREGPVEITRREQVTLVVLSAAEYQRLRRLTSLSRR